MEKAVNLPKNLPKSSGGVCNKPKTEDKRQPQISQMTEAREFSVILTQGFIRNKIVDGRDRLPYSLPGVLTGTV